MRNGNELDNHVIRENRKGCENRESKIEKGRGGDRENRGKKDPYWKTGVVLKVLNLYKMYIVISSLFCL